MKALFCSLAVIAAAGLLAGCSEPGETRTIYLLTCDRPYVYGQCKGREAPLSRTVRVFADSQQVVLKLPLIGAASLGRCEVFDGDNWHCRHEDGSGQSGMASGQYFRVPDKSTEFQVGTLRYWKSWLRTQF